MNAQKGFEPPKIESRVVCISTDYGLSAQLSTCFNDEGVYFAVLEPPRSFHKYWRNEFVKLNNVLAKVHPEKIIFLRVGAKMTDLIKKQLNLRNEKYEHINTGEEFDAFMSKFEDKFSGIIECPPDRQKIACALLEAKRKKFRLVLNDASQYTIRTDDSCTHILVSDSSSDLLPVILGNYAFAIGAAIRFFSCDLPYTPRQIYDILADTRGDDKRALSAKEIANDIKSSLEIKLDGLSQYKFVTFFTDDFQYGHFFLDIPNTHICNKLLPSHFIAGSIAQPNVVVQSAILVDTGFFPDSETRKISNLLDQKNVFIKELGDDTFSNLDLDTHIQFFPYDFLFICSHAGFPSGTRFKVEFVDKNDCDHVIVIDTIDSFDITDKGVGEDRLINVKTFMEFVELDGRPWYQKKYKKGSSKTVVEDFIAVDRNDWVVLEKKKVKMRFCNVIATKDRLGPYISMIHGISDPQIAPFIFNNACVSTYTMAANFVFAGSDFYIGTVNSVGDLSAIKVAVSFFEKTVDQNTPLALALWESQNEIGVPKQDKVYASIGCHFQKFYFPPDKKNRDRVKMRLKINATMRSLRVSRGDLEDSVKERHIDAIRFLLGEYKKLSQA